MNLGLAFRHRLAVRFFQAMALALPTTALWGGASCGDGGVAGGGGDSFPSVQCFTWPQPTATGTGGATTTTGTGGGGTGGGGTGGAAACPSRAAAIELFTATCGVSEVRSDGALKDGQCCYDVIENSCAAGRPFLVAGAPRTADPGGSEAFFEAGAAAPRVDRLSSNDRAALAAAWGADGLFEHASVASFGRFALELMAVGAPSELIEAAHRAALDEVRHARLCLGLASAYAGEVIAPAAFPFGGPVEVSADLADLAARAAREGCVGETLAAATAAAQLDRAEDPAVRAALTIIAEDEARHAELAWRTVAWAIRRGGARVRDAVAEAINAGIAGALAAGEASAISAVMIAHGRLDASARCQVVTRTIAEVVGPCAAAAARAGEAERLTQPAS